MTYSYALTQDTDWQNQTSWQVADTPFMSFAFWQTLIDTEAIGGDSGWLLIFITVYQDKAAANGTKDIKDIKGEETYKESTLVAVMPLFIKGHQRGEFVFDHAWAEAYARYGVDYYPRLVTSVPFTPITGQRLWLADGIELTPDILEAALAGVDNIAKQCSASSWHGLFVNDELAALANQLNQSAMSPQTIEQSLADSLAMESVTANSLLLLERQGCQFLWQNQNILKDSEPFTDFDEFLSSLTAKKRKNIRAERKKVANQGINCRLKLGAHITSEDWAAFYHCYVMTYAVRGQQPYLSSDFFTQLGETMPEHLMLAQALDSSGEIIASSLFLYDDPDSPNATLYGRYWGSLGEFDSLHFELCYYQGIEFAIGQGLKYFDPGTQGEHKLIRGFVPTKTHSLHRIYDRRFIPAISDFCEQDRDYMARYRQEAHDALPFNVDNMPDFKG